MGAYTQIQQWLTQNAAGRRVPLHELRFDDDEDLPQAWKVAQRMNEIDQWLAKRGQPACRVDPAASATFCPFCGITCPSTSHWTRCWVFQIYLHQPLCREISATDSNHFEHSKPWATMLLLNVLLFPNGPPASSQALWICNDEHVDDECLQQWISALQHIDLAKVATRVPSTNVRTVLTRLIQLVQGPIYPKPDIFEGLHESASTMMRWMHMESAASLRTIHTKIMKDA